MQEPVINFQELGEQVVKHSHYEKLNSINSGLNEMWSDQAVIKTHHFLIVSLQAI